MRYLMRERSWQLHMLMTVVGGFLGVYAILLRGNFGSAVTGNFLEMMIDLAEILRGEGAEPLVELMIRIGGALMFGLGLLSSVMAKRRIKASMERITIGVEALGVLIASLIPAAVQPLLALYPVFFITAFQWGTFAGTDGFNCATIFSTNNFRQFVTAGADYMMQKEEKDKRKACFYGLTILSFLLGAFVSALAVHAWGVPAVCVAWIPLTLACIRSFNI